MSETGSCQASQDASQQGRQQTLHRDEASDLAAAGARGAQHPDLAGAFQDGDVGGVGQAAQGDDQRQPQDGADDDRHLVELFGEEVHGGGAPGDHHALPAHELADGLFRCLRRAVSVGADPHHAVARLATGETFGGRGGDDRAPALPHPGGDLDATAGAGEGDLRAVGDVVDPTDDEGVVVQVLQARGGAHHRCDRLGVDGQHVELRTLGARELLGDAEVGDRDGRFDAVDVLNVRGQRRGVGLRGDALDGDVDGSVVVHVGAPGGVERQDADEEHRAGHDTDQHGGGRRRGTRGVARQVPGSELKDRPFPGPGQPLDEGRGGDHQQGQRSQQADQDEHTTGCRDHDALPADTEEGDGDPRHQDEGREEADPDHPAAPATRIGGVRDLPGQGDER